MDSTTEPPPPYESMYQEMYNPIANTNYYYKKDNNFVECDFSKIVTPYDRMINKNLKKYLIKLKDGTITSTDTLYTLNPSGGMSRKKRRMRKSNKRRMRKSKRRRRRSYRKKF